MRYLTTLVARWRLAAWMGFFAMFISLTALAITHVLDVHLRRTLTMTAEREKARTIAESNQAVEDELKAAHVRFAEVTAKVSELLSQPAPAK